jgi:hypothetical protein
VRLAYLILGLLCLLPFEAQAMPQVVVAVAASAAGGAAATAFGLTAGSFAFGIVSGAVGFAVSAVGSSIFGNSGGAKQSSGFDSAGSFQAEARGRTQVVRSAVETRKWVLGEVMLSGPLVYAEITGTSNKYLHLVIPLAAHEVQEIGEIRFNDEVVGTLDGSGNVTTGRFATYARIKKHLGSTSQTADSDLVAESASLWTTDHRLRGVAYIYVRLKWAQDIFPNGIPNIKALVKGAKLYDPRSATTAYSNNWALGVRAYLMAAAIDGGLEADSDEVDDTVIGASANTCDERVTMATHTNTFTASASADLLTLADKEHTIATGDGVQVSSLGSPSGSLPGPLLEVTTYYWIRKSDTTGQLATSVANALAGTAIDLTTDGSGPLTISHIDQARYTINGTIDLGKRPLDILADLMTGAAGMLTYPAGTFRVYPAAYSTPTVTLDEDDLRGGMNVTARIRRADLFNAVRGTYSAPSNFWQPSDFPVMTNSTYEAADGGEQIFRDIELPFTTDPIRAQRLAKIHLEKSRQGLTVQMPCKMTAFNLALWDTVMLDKTAMGWSAKVFRVVDWKLGANGFGVDLVLREDTSASYDWAAGDATVTDPAPDTNLSNAFVVATPGTPTVTETLYETTGSAGVKTRATVSWSAAADAFVSSYEAQFKPQAAADWLSLAPMSLTSAQAEDLAPGFYNFRVRAINSIGVRSDWSDTTTKELLGLTAPPADVSGFSIIKSAGVGIAQFSLHGDLDVRIGGRIVVRWSPLTTGATWNDSIIFEEFNGDAVSGMIPLRTGTYMSKARDSTGVYSTSAVSFVATEGLVTGFTTVGTLTEHTAFTGAKTNTAVVSSGLQLDGTTLIDSMVTSIDAWPFIDSLGGVSGTGSYAFTTHLDLSTVATRRFESTVAATQFDTGDLIDARTDLIDDWIDIDGATIEDCDATLYVRTTDDNPAGSPTWGAWTPFFVGDFTCRAAQFKLDLVSGSATHNIRITSLAVSAKVPT